MKRLALFCVLGVLLVLPAQGAEIISLLSQDQIQITSNYTGTDIVVFGAMEGVGEADSGYDVVVVVRGPDTDMVVRKKDRIAGLWINRDQASLGLPSFYFLAGTKSLEKIAPAITLERYGIGLQNLRPTRVISHHDSEPFRQALIRQQAAKGLYSQSFTAVEFNRTAFRVRVSIPADVARGQYTAEAYLFHDGTVESVQSSPLFIDQTGMERRLYNLAHNWPLFYGLTAVLLASLMGWLSAVVFKRPN